MQSEIRRRRGTYWRAAGAENYDTLMDSISTDDYKARVFTN